MQRCLCLFVKICNFNSFFSGNENYNAIIIIPTKFVDHITIVTSVKLITFNHVPNIWLKSVLHNDQTECRQRQ